MNATATPTLERPSWTPGVIMYANTQVQVIKVELPGVKMKDVQIAVEPGVLTVSGTSTCGTFLRRIPLCYNATLDRVQASLRQGVLEIRVPNPAT
jgi:HSP20 family molecular chaperone IbpA